MLLYKRWNAGKLGHLLEVWWSIKFNKHSLTWVQFEIVLKTDRNFSSRRNSWRKKMKCENAELRPKNFIQSA